MKGERKRKREREEGEERVEKARPGSIEMGSRSKEIDIGKVRKGKQKVKKEGSSRGKTRRSRVEVEGGVEWKGK